MWVSFQKGSVWIILISFITTIAACGGSSKYEMYAQAVKEQQITQQLMLQQERNIQEDKQRKHEAKMTQLAGDLAAAAAKSETERDDFMVPFVLSMMEDKYQMAQAEYYSSRQQPAPIAMKAPETTAEMIKSSTGLLLGVGAIALAGYQSKQMADIAAAGIAGAGIRNIVSGQDNVLTTDSYKTGSQNDIIGDANTINGGDICPTCDEEEEAEVPSVGTCLGVEGSFVDDDGYVWVDDQGCSCNSWLAGHCGPTDVPGYGAIPDAQEGVGDIEFELDP